MKAKIRELVDECRYCLSNFASSHIFKAASSEAGDKSEAKSKARPRSVPSTIESAGSNIAEQSVRRSLENVGTKKDAASQEKEVNADKNGGSGSATETEEEDVDPTGRILARQYYWRGIAAASILLGMGCIILSMNLRDQSRYQRRWTRR